MVRIFIILGITLLMTNCYFYRNDFNKKRYKVNIYKMKLFNNDSIFKIIDTTKVYELSSVFNISDNNYYNPFKKKFLKFYSKNKVASFNLFNINEINSINPKNAEMGYYCYSNGILTTQIYFESPQSAGYINDKNRLIFKSKNIVQFKSENYIDEYQIIDLPSEFLIYKPDW